MFRHTIGGDFLYQGSKLDGNCPDKGLALASLSYCLVIVCVLDITSSLFMSLLNKDVPQSIVSWFDTALYKGF